jgi:ABC-type Fe3+-hydroxamate transport system substrate-binding protein
MGQRMGPLSIVDDRGAKISLREPARRIVSLVPSDTYSLVRLGARDRIVGRTRYCVAPEGEVEGIAIVGGTKDVDVDRVAALAPDLVIANQEENSKRDVDRLLSLGLRVLVSFPQRLAAGVAHLARLARLIHPNDAARSVVARAYDALREAERVKDDRPKLRAFVPIWMDPLMTIHASTFISDVLAHVGAENVFADRERRYPLAADVGTGMPLPADRVAGRDVRYPRVTIEEVVAREPEIVLLPDEPHPFTETDAAVFRGLDIPAAKRGAVVFCDGKDLMWYGARGVEGLSKLRALVDAAR